MGAMHVVEARVEAALAVFEAPRHVSGAPRDLLCSPARSLVSVTGGWARCIG